MAFSLDGYDHILLDMNGTFVLDFDNFDAEQDYGATYQKSGYGSQRPDEADALVRSAYAYLAVRYVDDAYADAFPSVANALDTISEKPLTTQQRTELVDTFAQHEMGWHPEPHRRALAILAQLKPLSVLSNLWAPRFRWDKAFAFWGIDRHFQHVHFSSDGPCMKPSPRFFKQALDAMRPSTTAGRVLYVGDSYRCDVLGAQASGMDSVWLNRKDAPIPSRLVAQAVYRDLVSFVNDCAPSTSV